MGTMRLAGNGTALPGFVSQRPSHLHLAKCVLALLAHTPAHAAGHIRSPAIIVLGEAGRGELEFSSHLETAL